VRESTPVTGSPAHFSLWRRPARWPPGGFRLSPFRIGVGEYLLDYLGILDAMICAAPPKAGQVSMSIPNTRLRRCAQVIDAKRFADVRFRQRVNTLCCAAQLPAHG